MAPPRSPARKLGSPPPAQEAHFPKRPIRALPSNPPFRDEKTCWGIVQKHPRLAKGIVMRLRLDQAEGMSFEDAEQMVLINLFEYAKRWDPNACAFPVFAWACAKDAYGNLDRSSLINPHGLKWLISKYWQWREGNRAAPLEEFAACLGVGIARAKTIEDAALLLSSPGGGNSSFPATDSPNFSPWGFAPDSTIPLSSLPAQKREEMLQAHEADADRARFARALWVCISRLPAHNREAVCRYFCLDGTPKSRTFAQLAAEMGTNRSTLADRVHRGIGQVRAQLSSMGLLEAGELPSSLLADALASIFRQGGGSKEWEKEFPLPKKGPVPRPNARGKKRRYPRDRKRRGAFRSVAEAIALAEENRRLLSVAFQKYGIAGLPFPTKEVEKHGEENGHLREIPEWAQHIAFFNLFRSAAYWGGKGSFQAFAFPKLSDAMAEIRSEAFPDQLPRLGLKKPGEFLKLEAEEEPPQPDHEKEDALFRINAETYHYSTDAIPANPEELLLEKERHRNSGLINFALLDLTRKQAGTVRALCGLKTPGGEETDVQGFTEIGRKGGKSTQSAEDAWKGALNSLFAHPLAEQIRREFYSP